MTLLYMDYAATTPMSDKAMNAYLDTAKNFFENTESLHDSGQNAHDLLEHARSALGNLTGRDPRGIYFTGGGSDGNFLAITSLALGSKEKGKHIISSNVEHPSVDYALKYLETQGFEVTRIPVDETGKVTNRQIENYLRRDTILATIQHVNSETGIIQDLEELKLIFKKNNILFHSDCVQSFLKLDPDHFNSICLDSYTVSAHKIHGPKGTGSVYISPQAHISPILSGVTHERGFRPGTIDLPSIVSFVTAAEETLQLQQENYQHAAEMRKEFISLILMNKDIIFEGSSEGSPYILPFRIKGLEGQLVMQELNRRNIAVSTGSACKNGMQSPSKTLLAMGRNMSEAHGLVRVSLSRYTTKEHIYTLCHALNEITKQFLSDREVALR
jgi:cysteine desulfurase